MNPKTPTLNTWLKLWRQLLWALAEAEHAHDDGEVRRINKRMDKVEKSILLPWVGRVGIAKWPPGEEIA